MQPHILKSAETLIERTGILGVIICRGDIVYYYKTDPRFHYGQIRDFGQFVHQLFSGYLNVQRHISEVSLQFKGACLSVMMMKEGEAPIYVATLAENLQTLALATEETKRWVAEDLVKKSKRTAKITSKLRPTAHLLWGRFLSRLRDCLDKSLGAEAGGVVLTRTLEHFHGNSSEPLAKEQWLAFVAEVGNQIPNPDARVRFYKLYSEVDAAEAQR